MFARFLLLSCPDIRHGDILQIIIQWLTRLATYILFLSFNNFNGSLTYLFLIGSIATMETVAVLYLNVVFSTPF